MDKYLRGDELLQRWDIKDFQLLNFINDGLIPYNQREEAVLVKIVNHKTLPDGFLNSTGRLPTCEELTDVSLKELEYYSYTVYEKYFPDTQEILKHLPRYIIDNMVQTILATRDSSEERTRKLIALLGNDVTITIDLRKAEQLQQLRGLMFRKGDVEEEPAKANESPGEYVKRRRNEGVRDEIIACELHNQQGNFKLTYIQLVHELSQDGDLNEKQFQARKKRGERLCQRGRKILQESKKP